MNEAIAAQERSYLARALELAARGLYTTDPNPRVGCVIADAHGVVGEGWHMRAGEPHAEVLALRAAGDRARGATAYVTLEPCNHAGRTPPCTDALIAAGIVRTVCCSRDPSSKARGGIERLAAAGIDTSVGTLAAEARALNIGFFSRHERGRPYVRLKLAMSLDGRTAAAPAPAAPAPAGAGQRWISSEPARADVQRWRARSSAVLTGAGTVRSDDPQLDVRISYGPWVRQPLRVVLDTGLRLAPSAKIFAGEGALVFAADDASDDAREDNAPGGVPGGVPGGAADNAAAMRACGRCVARVPRALGGLNLHAVLERLAALEINELLLECGATLAAAFVAERLVDEIVLYVAPMLLGEDAAPLLRGQGRRATPPPWPEFEFADLQRIGADTRMILTVKQQPHACSPASS